MDASDFEGRYDGHSNFDEYREDNGPPQGQWTYADWEQLPDNDNHSEVIDGYSIFPSCPVFFISGSSDKCCNILLYLKIRWLWYA